MDESDPLYEYVRAMMIQIMAVLSHNGYRELHVGGMMRILGVPNHTAALHDDEIIAIDENFAKMAAELNNRYLMQLQVPSEATIH